MTNLRYHAKKDKTAGRNDVLSPCSLTYDSNLSVDQTYQSHHNQETVLRTIFLTFYLNIL
jgi:hypothetical protein